MGENNLHKNVFLWNVGSLHHMAVGYSMFSGFSKELCGSFPKHTNIQLVFFMPPFNWILNLSWSFMASLWKLLRYQIGTQDGELDFFHKLGVNSWRVFVPNSESWRVLSLATPQSCILKFLFHFLQQPQILVSGMLKEEKWKQVSAGGILQSCGPHNSCIYLLPTAKSFSSMLVSMEDRKCHPGLLTGLLDEDGVNPSPTYLKLFTGQSHKTWQ